VVVGAAAVAAAASEYQPAIMMTMIVINLTWEYV
jgi:hypothetical protein